MATSKIFYAGGAKGPNARADGKGGLLARGWYISVCTIGGTPVNVYGPDSYKGCLSHPQSGGAEIIKRARA
jgi:hypothetical protein